MEVKLEKEIISDEYKQIIKYLDQYKKYILKYGHLIDITEYNSNKLIEYIKNKLHDRSFQNIWSEDLAKEFLEILRLFDNINKIKDNVKDEKNQLINTINILEINCLSNITLDLKLNNSFMGSNINIKKISSGSAQTFFLTDDGYIYSYGKNCCFGQLGHGEIKTIEKPKKIDYITKKFKDISCGYCFTFIIDEDDEIYSCGAEENGRLANGNYKKDIINRFIKIDRKNIVINKIELGSTHGCIICSKKEVYTWGCKYYNGHNENNDLYEFKKLDKFDNQLIKDISIGYGGYHTACITYSGILYTWGHNRVGQLGYKPNKYKFKNKFDDSSNYVPFPIKIEYLGNTVEKVKCGWGHTLILTNENYLYSCGRNDNCDIGIDNKIEKINLINDRNTIYVPYFTKIINELNIDIKDIFICQNINFVVSKSGKVYYFGSNKSASFEDSTLHTNKYNNEFKIKFKLLFDSNKKIFRR